MQHTNWTKTAILFSLGILALFISGCGAKLESIRKVDNEKIEFSLQECKRVDGNLECVINLKTKAQVPKFYIRTQEQYHPRATDSQDRLMRADAYYINGVDYFKKWIGLGAFKSYPSLIVFPDLAKDAKLIKRIEFLFATKDKESWNVVFTNIELTS